MKKILIVDDSEELLEILKETMETEGYETDCLSHTSDICDDAHKAGAQLVILDYILLGVNGGELCHQLKNDARTKHLPVIIISAYPRVLKSLGNYGADAIIAKPFDLSHLLNEVNICFNGHKAMA